ncbi:MAG: beta-hydroxyacyl-ACP dehydratase [Pirellulales bacterium]|nr:beta-hydroxyacyl-ACP dehydratase [Pirellulales bacterium]
MRWYWIDRFLEFESGRAAVAVKTVSLSEEHLHDHFPGCPLMPNSLVIEGFAQLGGILVGEHIGFAGNMILAKVPKAEFEFSPQPGDTLTYRAKIEYVKEDGALVAGESHIGDKLHAKVEVFFANVLETDRSRRLFSDAELLAMMKMLGVYRVGRTATGEKLVPPKLGEIPDPARLAGRS